MIKLYMRGIALVLALLLTAGPVRAEMVRDMYSAEVSVSDQSSAELARASRVALSEVLVKVSGSVEVLRNPVIAQALRGARGQVQRFSYGSDPAAPDRLVVSTEFDKDYITGLVIEAGVPLWTANRPSVLVWLVTDDGGGRRFVSADGNPELVAMLQAEFSRRGVPLQLPLYDLVDTAALSPDQAWRLDDPAVIPASARYRLQDVLVGRFSPLASGGIVGEWGYLRADSHVLRSPTAKNEEQYVRQGVALVAEAMAARYAVAATVDGGGLTMSVTGVTGYADYAAIVVWLESLELVEHANVESVRGDAITLRLEAQADASQLATIIELNKRLVALPLPSPGTQLSYQWQQ